MDNQKKSITDWAEQDRPREKLMLHGKQILTDAELIAILIGSGNAELSAVDLSRNILAHYNNDLNQLAKVSLNDLTKFKGIGEAKAISIMAALELGRRRKETISEEKPKINSAPDAYEFLKPYMLDLPHEEFWIILLDTARKVIKPIQISKGGINATVSDVRIIYKYALENFAISLIAAHNHPSGNLAPSQADISLTKSLKEAGKLMQIKLDDHLIFTNNGFYSFAEKGLLE